MSNSPHSGRPIRVLHVIDTLGPGGAEHQLVTLLPHLQRQGIECEVAILQGSYALVPIVERYGMPVYKMDHRDGRNFLSTSYRISVLLREREYDIVHAHLWNSTMAVGFSKLRSRNPKRFVTFHNSAYQQFPAKSLTRRMRKLFDRLLLRYSFDRCIGVTQFIASSNQELLGIPNVETIFNGVELSNLPAATEQEKRATREQLGCGRGDALIVTAGRLNEQKGHTVLIDAIASLPQQGAQIKTVIFGEGALREKLQKKISSLGLESKISMPGSVDHATLFQAIAAADLFVFPSIHEPFGLAAAEAMALGTPVIASAVDGLPEFIEDGVSGKLVQAGDAQEVAKVIAQLLVDPSLRQQLGSAGLKRVKESLDIAVLSGKLVSLYRAALGIGVSSDESNPSVRSLGSGQAM
ncbi:MAG: glycosyltransferase family 4 protein [Terriglobales bacterium]